MQPIERIWNKIQIVNAVPIAVIIRYLDTYRNNALENIKI